MAKLTLPTISSGFLSVDKLNEALSAIAAALDNTLSRNGATPNQMEADLDMNGHAILNMSVEEGSSLVTLDSMQEYVDARASGLLVQRQQQFTATASQQVFTLTEFTYSPGSLNIGVYVDGVRKFTPTDFIEVSPTGIQFLVGLSVGQKVSVIQNDFLSTVELPTHTHPWAQITGTPVYTTRWPTYAEVTDKPTTFTPTAHTHSAADITSGRLADARRGVYVQASQPAGLGAGDAGVLWFWGA